ncbi:MAG TPA: prepilin-type N-terminal cleavage/methylation domain-containing protein [Candidatus Paceibacterota bacterium]
MLSVIRSKNKGFTLVELLVVIAIIGILSSVVMASLNMARSKARDAKRISDVKQIQLALEMHYDSFNRYPITLGDANLATYLTSIPTDPLSGNSYVYVSLGGAPNCTTATSYHLGAAVEDPNNLVLTSSKRGAAASLNVCTGSDPAADFNGKTDDCTAGADAGTQPSKCYDIKP